MSGTGAWWLDLDIGLDEGGFAGMRAAQCASNREFAFTRNIRRDDDGGAAGITAWIDDRQIHASLFFFQEEQCLHMFRMWLRCRVKRGQLQKVTKIWNWIDGGDVQEAGLSPELWWNVLRTECPWAFSDPSDTNSCQFTYGANAWQLN